MFYVGIKYGTMDRGSFNGKHVYNTFQEAKTKFLDFLADIVIINRYYAKEGMPVNYLSPPLGWYHRITNSSFLW